MKSTTTNKRRGGEERQRDELRVADAKERNEAWAQLTPAEQIEHLDRRLGKGLGAKKQRARIARQAGRRVAA